MKTLTHWNLKEVLENKTGIPFVDKGLELGWKAGFPLLDQALAQVTLNNPLLESLVSRIDPVLSTQVIKATVVNIIQETGDTKTYVMKPNARWRTYKPGSYIHLKFIIDGQVVTRTYTLSSNPLERNQFSITVKKVPNGKVSHWLFDHMKIGETLEISEPGGKFVLPEVSRTKLLMISGGSGITPVMSMLRYLTALEIPVDIVFLHCARSPEDIIFHKELGSIAEKHANVRLKLAVDEAHGDWGGFHGRFDQKMLETAAPDYQDRDLYLCGPGGFMEAVIGILETTGYDLNRLNLEHFTPTARKTWTASEGSASIRFERSGVEAAVSEKTILEIAEAEGLKPASGCRMGICSTCRCKKVKGTVIDINTGQVSSDGEEYIYPCISVAQGEVQLDL